jgi:hypothetical protein
MAEGIKFHSQLFVALRQRRDLLKRKAMSSDCKTGAALAHSSSGSSEEMKDRATGAVWQRVSRCEQREQERKRQVCTLSVAERERERERERESKDRPPQCRAWCSLMNERRS